MLTMPDKLSPSQWASIGVTGSILCAGTRHIIAQPPGYVFCLSPLRFRGV
ncbi:phage holin family protein [Lelliottia amnigena]